MYSTDAKSTEDDFVMRLFPSSPDGVNEKSELTSIPCHTAFRAFLRMNPEFSSSADFYPVNAHLRRLCSTTVVERLRQVDLPG
jgi:hypothetical protein